MALDQHRNTKRTVVFDGSIGLDHAYDIAKGHARLSLSDDVRRRCDAAFERLQEAVRQERHIYGITTGFGPLANRLVPTEAAVRLQQNLVHHLASGLGAPLPWSAARAMVLARTISILQGYSGASRQVIDTLLEVLNSDLAPLIPERGTVGASGDLTPLSHMVLAFQGRGAFIDAQGRRFSGQEALDRLDLSPLRLNNRDGLALVNGTSAMTGIALCTSRRARRLCDWATALSAAYAECLEGRSEAWSPVLADIKGHAGQKRVTEALNLLLEGSTRVTTQPIAARRLEPATFLTEAHAGQDPYTVRCVPQVIGAVVDALRWHDETIASELNSVSDNPVFPPASAVPALHGGNFMGQHVALASDTLSMALAVMAGLAERQIARLTDETMNRGLPAFLHRGEAGLNSGLMGAQVTATATLAEMRTWGPASLQSISTNAANQDVVSMGTIAARKASDTALLAADVLAILAIAVSQAKDILDDSGQSGFGRGSEWLVQSVRHLTPPITEDRPLSDDIAKVSELILSTDFPSFGAAQPTGI